MGHQTCHLLFQGNSKIAKREGSPSPVYSLQYRMNYKKTFLVILLLCVIFLFQPIKVFAIGEKWTTPPELYGMESVEIPVEYTEMITLNSETSCNSSSSNPIYVRCVPLWRPVLTPIYQRTATEPPRLISYELQLAPQRGIPVCSTNATGNCSSSYQYTTESVVLIETPSASPSGTSNNAQYGRSLQIFHGSTSTGRFYSVLSDVIASYILNVDYSGGTWIEGATSVTNKTKGVYEFGYYDYGIDKGSLSRLFWSGTPVYVSYSDGISVTANSWGLNDPYGNGKLPYGYQFSFESSGSSGGDDDDSDYPLPPALIEDLIDEIDGDWGTWDFLRVGLNKIIGGLNNVWRFISNLFRTLFGWLLDGLKYLFVPDDEVISTQTDVLKDLVTQKAFFGGWEVALNNLKSAFTSDVASCPPALTATIFGQPVTLLNFNLIDPHIGIIRNFLGAFIFLIVVVLIVPKLTRILLET